MGLGIDLYVPSLPAIAKYFQVSNNLVQLTISLYVLAAGIGHLILGIISDSLGEKKNYINMRNFLYHCQLLISFRTQYLFTTMLWIFTRTRYLWIGSNFARSCH